MTFLQPAFLWGLLAISIPIIVHFFNLQRPRQVLFSNVAFVREVKKTVVRRLKFKQWLLLLARVLAISCLVLAFANPVILNEERAFLMGNRSVAVVLDNSYSMSTGNEKGQYFKQAHSMARNIFRAYGPQDEFLLMNTHDLKLNYNFSGQDEVLEELAAVQIRQNTRSHTDMLRLLEEIFARANNRIKELYFISDFQLSTVMADSLSVPVPDSSYLLKYIPLATREQKNVYISGHQILSRILEKNKPVQLSMTLVNDGNSTVNELGVRVWLNGKVVALDNSQLEAQSSKTISLPFTPTSSGWQSGYIELDDYPVEFDNKRYFSIYVPEKEKVLVIEGTPSRHLRLLYESVFEQFDAHFVSSRNLANEDLNAYKSLILLGVKEVSSGLADRLQTFMNEGGSLMFFPGEGMDLEQVNAWLKELKLGSFGQLQQLPEGSLMNEVDLQHPIFEGIFSEEQRKGEFDAPRVYKYYPLNLNNQLVHNRIISLESRAPMLVESRIGQGVMFTFTFFPGDSWTDFHVKTIFAPILFRATQVMNQSQHIQQGQELGALVPYLVRTTEQELISLVNSEGQEMFPEQYPQGGGMALKFDKLDLKEGNYQLVQDGKLLGHISFNISDSESRLKQLNAEELQRRLSQQGQSGIEILQALPEAISSQIQTEKEGTPLWKYFVMLALFFLLAEVVILQIKD